MIWTAEYTNAHLCALVAGAASVAVKKGTSQIWFRRSLDGATWNSEPILVGTMTTGKAAHVHQKAISGSSELIVTDGFQVWCSRDMGRTWKAI